MQVRGETVLVAFSGGADSTALLHALWRLRARLRCSLVACHIHHDLRGETAAADARHAAAVATELGIPFVERCAEVRSYARANRVPLEAAARTVRYELLEAAADGAGAARIATGHTADDQAETVLLNLLRGAGPAGLSGIPPARGRVIRPLLELTHAQAEAYCRAEGCAFCVDESNLDLRFTRNRIRHEVMPLLRRLQPRAAAALCRLADIMREENAYLSAEADRLLGEGVRLQGESAVVSLDSFAGSPLALQRRLVRRLVAQLKGDETDLELERTDAVVRLGRYGRTGSVAELQGGLQAERRHAEIVIGRARPRGEWQLAVPGSVLIPELGVRLDAVLSEGRSSGDDAGCAVLDADTVTGPLTVRTWRAGDRFVPLRRRDSVRVQDLLGNAKVPRAERSRMPLVLSGDRIVWIAGFGIDDRSRATSRTRRTLRLTSQQLQQ